jgi:hypothetical protein
MHLCALFSKGTEGVDDEAGGRAVENIDGRRADPGLRVSMHMLGVCTSAAWHAQGTVTPQAPSQRVLLYQRALPGAAH